MIKVKGRFVITVSFIMAMLSILLFTGKAIAQTGEAESETKTTSAASAWTSVAPMLVARDQFTGGVINGKIYVFGGNGNPNGTNLKSTEVYDPATNQWSYVANNEHNGGEGVEELSGAVVNNKLYVFGGYGGYYQGVYGRFNFVEEYNPVTDIWTSKAPKPTVSGGIAVVYNNEIFVFGGGTPNNGETNVVEAYNPATNSWRSVTTIPLVVNKTSLGIAVIGNKAYLFGGYDGSTISANIISYDFTNNTWTTSGYAPIPSPRVFSYAGSVPVVNGKIYLIGGITGNSNQDHWGTNIVEIYDLASNSWSTGASLPTTISNQVTLVLNDTIYSIGGITEHNNSGEDEIRTNAVWKYTVGIPVPNSKQSFSYSPVETPVISSDPAQAKPVGLGSVAINGNTLSIQIGLNQFSGPVDIYGAFTVSADPLHVNILNSNGTSFSSFLISDIINALSTGIRPAGADPWRTNVTGPINEHLFDMPVSSIPAGSYTVYLM